MFSVLTIFEVLLLGFLIVGTQGYFKILFAKSTNLFLLSFQITDSQDLRTNELSLDQNDISVSDALKSDVLSSDVPACDVPTSQLMKRLEILSSPSRFSEMSRHSVVAEMSSQDRLKWTKQQKSQSLAQEDEIAVIHDG